LIFFVLRFFCFAKNNTMRKRLALSSVNVPGSGMPGYI